MCSKKLKSTSFFPSSLNDNFPSMSLSRAISVYSRLEWKWFTFEELMNDSECQQIISIYIASWAKKMFVYIISEAKACLLCTKIAWSAFILSSSTHKLQTFSLLLIMLSWCFPMFRFNFEKLWNHNQQPKIVLSHILRFIES